MNAGAKVILLFGLTKFFARFFLTSLFFQCFFLYALQCTALAAITGRLIMADKPEDSPAGIDHGDCYKDGY